MSDREERIARNELAFRQANETLRAVFEGAPAEGPDESFPFLCECGERRCTNVVCISLETYGRIRSHPARFAIVPGHKQLETELIVEEGAGYEVIEKTGHAGEIARAPSAEAY
jgi:hypothetical protein